LRAVPRRIEKDEVGVGREDEWPRVHVLDVHDELAEGGLLEGEDEPGHRLGTGGEQQKEREGSSA
jgi:hypothetical protein